MYTFGKKPLLPTPPPPPAAQEQAPAAPMPVSEVVDKIIQDARNAIEFCKIFAAFVQIQKNSSSTKTQARVISDEDVIKCASAFFKLSSAKRVQKKLCEFLEA